MGLQGDYIPHLYNRASLGCTPSRTSFAVESRGEQESRSRIQPMRGRPYPVEQHQIPPNGCFLTRL